MTLQKPDGYNGHMSVAVLKNIRAGKTVVVADLYPETPDEKFYAWSWEQGKWIERDVYDMGTPGAYAVIEIPAGI